MRTALSTNIQRIVVSENSGHDKNEEESYNSLKRVLERQKELKREGNPLPPCQSWVRAGYIVSSPSRLAPLVLSRYIKLEEAQLTPKGRWLREDGSKCPEFERKASELSISPAFLDELNYRNLKYYEKNDGSNIPSWIDHESPSVNNSTILPCFTRTMYEDAILPRELEFHTLAGKVAEYESSFDSQSTSDSLTLLQHRIREVGDLMANETKDKEDKNAKIAAVDKASSIGNVLKAYNIWPWSYEETLYLLMLCQKYNLCWAAIADRYSFSEGENVETGLSYYFDKSKCPIWYDADAWEYFIGLMAKCRRDILSGNSNNMSPATALLAQQHAGGESGRALGAGAGGIARVDLDEGQTDISLTHSQLNIPGMREVGWPLQRSLIAIKHRYHHIVKCIYENLAADCVETMVEDIRHLRLPNNITNKYPKSADDVAAKARKRLEYRITTIPELKVAFDPLVEVCRRHVLNAWIDNEGDQIDEELTTVIEKLDDKINKGQTPEYMMGIDKDNDELSKKLLNKLDGAIEAVEPVDILRGLIGNSSKGAILLTQLEQKWEDASHPVNKLSKDFDSYNELRKYNPFDSANGGRGSLEAFLTAAKFRSDLAVLYNYKVVEKRVENEHKEWTIKLKMIRSSFSNKLNDGNKQRNMKSQKYRSTIGQKAGTSSVGNFMSGGHKGGTIESNSSVAGSTVIGGTGSVYKEDSIISSDSRSITTNKKNQRYKKARPSVSSLLEFGQNN